MNIFISAQRHTHVATRTRTDTRALTHSHRLPYDENLDFGVFGSSQFVDMGCAARTGFCGDRFRGLRIGSSGVGKARVFFCLFVFLCVFCCFFFFFFFFFSFYRPSRPNALKTEKKKNTHTKKKNRFLFLYVPPTHASTVLELNYCLFYCSQID